MNLSKIGLFNRNSVSSTIKPVLELFPENKTLKEFYNVTEFKKMNIERNQNINKKDKFDTYLNQSDLNIKEKFNSILNEEDDFQMVNSFLDLGNENELILDFDSENKLNQMKILRHKILSNKNFYSGIFSDFGFVDKAKDIILSSLTLNEKENYSANQKIELLNLSKDVLDNDLILDICINQHKDYTKIFRNESLVNSSDLYYISEDENLLKEKEKAIFEYKNQIMTYLKLNEIEKQMNINYNTPQDESLDFNAYTFFKSHIIKEKNKALKNKLKLILRTLNYIDPVSKIPVVTNKIKNEILRAWRENYNFQLKQLLEKKKAELEKKKLNKEKKHFMNELINSPSIKKRNSVNYILKNDDSTFTPTSPMKKKRKISGKFNPDFLKENRRKSSILFYRKKQMIRTPIKNKSNSKNISSSNL
jgi:hypothetical protein